MAVDGEGPAGRSPSVPMSTISCAVTRSIRLRFEPEAHSGGLKPYLHVRRDLWARVTRALFFDLVEMSETRNLNGKEWFGIASAGEFFSMAPAESVTGLR
jgi:hypothetical protein